MCYFLSYPRRRVSSRWKRQDWLRLLSVPAYAGTTNKKISDLQKSRTWYKNSKIVMSESPIFESIFQSHWADLPAVMHKHYANRPYSNDTITATGVMGVEVSFFARLLAPLMRWTGALTPVAGQNIPVTVRFESEPDSRAFCLHRVFHYPAAQPYVFRSRMIPIGGNEVIEQMPAGIGWKAAYHWDGAKIKLVHRGYTFRLAGRFYPLPLAIFFGKGYAEEWAINDHQFQMKMEIRHPIWGKVYAYHGIFTLPNF
jgi:hypothetical protein